ncbi:hypothetical protein LXL04_020895 [Taraxacum kok-saghyz]
MRISDRHPREGTTMKFRSFNLGGMGCSAGVIAIDLANDMLLVSLVLPISEQLLFFCTLIIKNFFNNNIKPYIPVIDELEAPEKTCNLSLVLMEKTCTKLVVRSGFS